MAVKLPINVGLVKCGIGRGVSITFNIADDEGTPLIVTRCVFGVDAPEGVAEDRLEYDSDDNDGKIDITTTVGEVTIIVQPEDTAELTAGVYAMDAAVELEDDDVERRDAMVGQLQLIPRMAVFE